MLSVSSEITLKYITRDFFHFEGEGRARPWADPGLAWPCLALEYEGQGQGRPGPACGQSSLVNEPNRASIFRAKGSFRSLVYFPIVDTALRTSQ